MTHSKSPNARDGKAVETVEMLLGVALIATAAGWGCALALWLWGSIELVGFLAALATVEAFALAVVWFQLRRWRTLARDAIREFPPRGSV